MNENLDNLKLVLAALKEDHLGRKEFDERIKEVLTVMVSLRKHIEQEVEGAVNAFKGAQERQVAQQAQSLAELEKRVDRLFVEEKLSEMSTANQSELESLRNQVQERLSALRDGVDGVDASEVDEEALAARVLARVKVPAAEVVDTEKLKKEIMSSIPQRLGSIGASVVHKFIDDETPSGSINGSNVTFYLAKAPINGSLKLFLGGARQRVTEDFTLAGKTITFTIAPDTGSVLLCDYRFF